jgi:diguanylate cyclase (GGDEF)-like protein
MTNGDRDGQSPEDQIAHLKAEVEHLQRRLAELEILADRDPLTPVLNRRAFMRELARVCAYCQRYGTTCSVVFFDMDGFKAINDQFGHAGGDAALQAVAGSLAAHVRESDVVGRLGGDEFAVILAQADKAAAKAKAQSLKGLLESDPAIYEGRAIPLRLSFGVRSFEAGLTAAELLAEADAAMYLSKPGGGLRP